jgi:hypothetical protein
MRPKNLLLAALVLSGIMVSCTASNQAVSDSRFRSPLLPKGARIQVATDVASDDNHGVCLLVTLRNRGHTEIGWSFWKEFDQFSLQVIQKGTNGYVLVNPRPDTNSSGGTAFEHSNWNQFVAPSEGAAWKIPLRLYYDLKPGSYVINVTLHAGVDSEGVVFPVSITAGPLGFNIPDKPSRK